jgi:hypothetical protein
LPNFLNKFSTNKNAAVVNFETNLKMIEALANAFGCTKEHRKIIDLLYRLFHSINQNSIYNASKM